MTHAVLNPDGMQERMKRVICTVIVMLTAAVPGHAGSRQVVTDIQLQGTLLEVGYLGDIGQSAIPTDFDASFAITIRIVACAPANTRFTVGRTVTFAIHSPTFLFMGDPKIGKTYRFSLRQLKKGERSSFEDLAVIREARK